MIGAQVKQGRAKGGIERSMIRLFASVEESSLLFILSAESTSSQAQTTPRGGWPSSAVRWR